MWVPNNEKSDRYNFFFVVSPEPNPPKIDVFIFLSCQIDVPFTFFDLLTLFNDKLETVLKL